MKMKSIIILAVVLFSFGFVGISFAVDIQGKIVSITGGHDFDVKDKSGKVMHREEALPPDLKVGDMVTIKNGNITKDAVQDSALATPTKKKSSKGK